MGHYVEQVRAGDPYGPRAARRDVMYRAYVPDPIGDLDYAPSPATYDALLLAAEQTSRLDARAQGSLARISRLLGLLCRSEGVGSSTIEGYAAPVAKIVVAEATDAGSRALTTAGIVRDGIRAVEAALRLLGDPDAAMTPDTIEQVQRDLMRHHNAALSGYRTGHVQVGGDISDPTTADFVPPPATEVQALMADLCAFVDNVRTPLHPIARAAIAHVQFETIHPFPDGNGRVGRTLIQAMLRREGMTSHAIVPISLAISRDEASMRAYMRALDAMRGDAVEATDLDVVVETFAGFVADAAGRAMAMIDQADRVYDDLVRVVAAGTRADSAARALIDVVAAHVGITVAAAASETGLAAQTVRNGLERMRELGVLESRSGGRFGRVYFVPALVALIEDATGAPTLASDEARLDASGTAVAVGTGRGRPRSGPRCGKPLRTEGTCMRPAGHAGGCRARP